MRPIVLALALASGCAPFVRGDEAAPDAGEQMATVIELNGSLAAPGIPLSIAPLPVVSSPKFYLRKATGNAPNCYYGIFVEDPGQAGQPNNGVLLVAEGDMSAINADPNLGGATRTTCPYPESYAVGGNIPDGLKVGDQVQVSGELAPYCDYYNTSLGQCSTPLFPEFQVATITPPSSATTYPTATVPAPIVVNPSDISDLSQSAIQYAGELLEVDNVTIGNGTPDPYGDVVLGQGSLWVTSLSSTVTVPTTDGTPVAKLVGVLHYQFQHWKLRPRTQADVCVSAPCP